MPAQFRFRPRLAALTAGLLLAGCAAPTVAPPAPTADAGTSPTETQAQPQTPAAAPVAEASGLVLNGVATLPSAPFADATVSAYPAGETTAVATARAAADGTFALAIPAAHAGRLLRIVASHGTTSLVGAATVEAPAPAQRRVAQALPTRLLLRLTLGGTVAYLTLASRYQALAGLSLNDAERRTALEALQKATTAAQAALGSLSPQETDALLAGIGPSGDGSVPSALAARLAPRGGELASSLIDAAFQLNSLLKAGSGSGNSTISTAELESVVFAGALLNGAHSGGGGTSGLSGSLSVGAPDDAVFSGNSSAVAAGHAPGAVIDAYQLAGTPAALVSDGADGMWVASTTTDGYTVVHLTPSLATAKTVRRTSTDGATAVAMVTDGAGGVWLSARAHGAIVHVTDTAATSRSVGGQPAVLVADDLGGAWVGDGLIASVAHVTEGAITPVALPGLPARMAADGTGGIFVGSDTIGAVSHVVGTLTTPTGDTVAVSRMVPGGAGDAWYLDGGSNRLYRANEGATPYTGLDADRLVAGEEGSVWYSTGGQLRRVGGTGAAAMTPGAVTYLEAASDGLGGLWCTTATGALHVVGPTEPDTVTTQVATTLGGAPTLVSVDAGHNGWVAMANGRVYEVAK